ncbi:MAG: N-acetylmuramoyl-L-alanine amidase [Pyrinomonadaceae bacterium]|nr:N-acetylmuramoyl-L-alanine amidase [Pyrinomonadaceae bacterium]
MAHSLIWLPEVLTRADLKVSKVPGWENRGKLDVGRIFGVICHHTVGGLTGNMPSLNVLVNGRPAQPARPGRPAKRALPGPLAQLGLARDGTYYVITAGRANHAGAGSFQDIVNGNSNFIGIEAENGGEMNDFPWPKVQLDAYYRGVAAILRHIGRGAESCCGHKEYAPKRKPLDPRLDMNAFRSSVKAILEGTAPKPVLIPPVEPPAQPGGLRRPTLRRGMKGDLTKRVQEELKVQPAIGNFGPKTEAAVRAFQRAHDLVPDGIIGPKTWLELDKVKVIKP